MKQTIYSVTTAMQSTNRRSLLGGLALAILALPFTGCGRSDIQVYKVAKEQSSAATTTHSSSAPAGWEEAPRGEMRVASYRIRGEAGKTAEVSVIPLPGGAGREVDNVNRWRSAVGLPEVTENDLPRLSEKIEVGGKPAPLYELAGETPGSGEKERMLVAIVRRDDAAWFFKMLGDDEIVAKQKPAFVSYLKQFDFNTSGGGSSGPTAGSDAQPQLPPSHPPIGAALGASAPLAGGASTEGRPDWQVPANWREIPGGQFLVAKFTMPGTGNNAATVNVSSSAGTGGGVAMNVNRWRGQLGLNELSDADVTKLATPVDISGGKASLVDMTGTDPRSGQKTRLLAAIVPQNNQTWFYKLMGPEATVGEGKDAFLAFIKSAKYK